MRRNGPRGQSLNAARCALVSTVALLGCAVTQGSVRATLAVVWILLLITAVALEWSARRRVRTELAVQASKRSSKARPRNRAR
jgi:hypothetical protein